MSINFNPTSSNFHKNLSHCPRNTIKSTAPSFHGYTRIVMNTLEAKRPFLSTEEFLNILENSQSKIAGRLPKEFLSLYPENPRRVFDFFNDFSKYVQKKNVVKSKIRNSAMQDSVETICLSSGKKLNASYVSEGAFGSVYKLSVGGNDFAFKSYIDDEFSYVHGAMAEMSTGLYFSDKKYKDLSDFYIADYSNQWMLSRYISDDILNETDRVHSFKDVNSNLIFNDDGSRNYVNKYRVDYGGIDLAPPSEPFYKGLYPCCDLKDIDNEVEDLKKYPGFEIKSRVKELMKTLNLDGRKELFYFLLNQKNQKLKTGLASQLPLLLENELVEKAFYDIVDSGDKQAIIGIQKCIPDLPFGAATEAIRALLKSNGEIQKRGLASYISYLIPYDRGDIFYSILESPSYSAKSGLTSSLKYLLEKDVSDATKRLEDFYNSLKFSTFKVEE